MSLIRFLLLAFKLILQTFRVCNHNHLACFRFRFLRQAPFSSFKIVFCCRKSWQSKHQPSTESNPIELLTSTNLSRGLAVISLIAINTLSSPTSKWFGQQIKLNQFSSLIAIESRFNPWLKCASQLFKYLLMDLFSYKNVRLTKFSPRDHLWMTPQTPSDPSSRFLLKPFARCRSSQAPRAELLCIE